MKHWRDERPGAWRCATVAAWALSLPVAAGCAEPLHIDDAPYRQRMLQGGGGEAGVAIADFNRDGHPDLALTGDAQHLLTILFGDGRGGFTAGGSYPAGRNPTDVAAADLDGDGQWDIAIVNHETQEITVLVGEDRGRFRAASSSPLRIAVAPHPHAVRVADLDRDGVPDLLVDHRDGGGVLVLRGLGKARFDVPGRLVDTGGDPYLGFEVADVNGDGWPDLVTPNPDHVGIVTHAGTAGIAFRRAVPVEAHRPFAVAVADLDADGHPDLVAVPESGAADVSILLGDGRLGFRKADMRLRLPAGAKRAVTGDVNGDGITDVVIGGWSPGLLLLLGGTDGIRPQSLAVPGIDHPWGLAVADLNEDGRDDLVVADGMSTAVAVLLSSDGR